MGCLSRRPANTSRVSYYVLPPSCLLPCPSSGNRRPLPFLGLTWRSPSAPPLYLIVCYPTTVSFCLPWKFQIAPHQTKFDVARLSLFTNNPGARYSSKYDNVIFIQVSGPSASMPPMTNSLACVFPVLCSSCHGLGPFFYRQPCPASVKRGGPNSRTL